MEGEAINIQDVIKGKPAVIVFWAMWAKPSVVELDTISRYYKEWQNKYDAQVIGISIDIERQMNKLKQFLTSKEKIWGFLILTDTNGDNFRGIYVKREDQGIPRTIFINSNGEIVYEHSGYLPGDESIFEEKVKSISNK